MAMVKYLINDSALGKSFLSFGVVSYLGAVSVCVCVCVCMNHNLSTALTHTYTASLSMQPMQSILPHTPPLPSFALCSFLFCASLPTLCANRKRKCTLNKKNV